MESEHLPAAFLISGLFTDTTHIAQIPSNWNPPSLGGPRGGGGGPPGLGGGPPGHGPGA